MICSFHFLLPSSYSYFTETARFACCGHGMPRIALFPNIIPICSSIGSSILILPLPLPLLLLPLLLLLLLPFLRLLLLLLLHPIILLL